MLSGKTTNIKKTRLDRLRQSPSRKPRPAPVFRPLDPLNAKGISLDVTKYAAVVVSRTNRVQLTKLPNVGTVRLAAEQGNLLEAIIVGRDELLMMQLLSGGGSLHSGGWLQGVFLAFLLAVPVFSPERIRVASSYRRAFLCFAYSIIVPSGAAVLMTSLLSPFGAPGGGFPGIQTFHVFNAAGPVLFGISLIYAMKAIVPGFIPPQDVRRPTIHNEPVSTVRGGSIDGHVAEPKAP